MVTMNYQLYGGRGFHLRLRMYDGVKTKYIVVTNQLKGDLQRRHFNAKKQVFTASAPFAEENNAFLYSFKERQKSTICGGNNLFSISRKSKTVLRLTKLHEVVDWCLENAKQSVHEDGTVSGTYVNYQKLKNRLVEYCLERGVKYNSVPLSVVDSDFVNSFLDWKRETSGGRGMIGASSALRSVLNKANKHKWYDIGLSAGSNWIKTSPGSSHKYFSLNEEQCNKLINAPLSCFPSCKKSELYRDICVFMLHTCMAPCDAVSLEWSNIHLINGHEYIVIKRRKTFKVQSVDCLIPVNPLVKEIMDKYKTISSDGYVFPVRSKHRIKKTSYKNGDISSFRKGLNKWLWGVGKVLGCKEKLHAYVFRHTGITIYISKGVPVTYVSNLAGTSVKNIENIYYNNRGDSISRDMVMNAFK